MSVVIIVRKAVDVSGEARIPAGQAHGGEWTAGEKTAGPHPSLNVAPSTLADRNQAKTRGVIVPPTSWGLSVAEDPDAKIQARWYDSKGKQQYGYHPRAIAERDAHKFGAIDAFADAVPRIRAKVTADLNKPHPSKDKAAAAVVSLLDQLVMRVGSEEFALENETFGASSLRKSHVRVEGDTVHLSFFGKHHQSWERAITDTTLAHAITQMLALPGDRLFQYEDRNGVHPVNELTVRAYLKPFGVIPKQFRTYHATRLATEFLREMGTAGDEKTYKKNITLAVKRVSEVLGNTPSVCQSSYINPAVLNAYHQGYLNAQMGFNMEKAVPTQKADRDFKVLLAKVKALLLSGKITDVPDKP